MIGKSRMQLQESTGENSQLHCTCFIRRLTWALDHRRFDVGELDLRERVCGLGADQQSRQSSANKQFPHRSQGAVMSRFLLQVGIGSMRALQTSLRDN